MFGDLYAQGGNAAASAGNEYRFTGLQPRDGDEHVPGCASDNGQRSHFYMAEVGWLGDEIKRRDKHIFRQSTVHVLADNLMLRANCDIARAAKLAFTAGYQRIHRDFITGGPARHLCANRIYHTGNIDAGGQWQGDGAKLRTAADADVKPIQGAGVDSDAYFVPARFGDRQLLQLDDIALAVFMENCC